MSLLLQIRFPEFFYRCQDFAGFDNGIDSPVRQAAVGGLPKNLNFYPGKPFMGNDDIQIRRLTDNTGCDRIGYGKSDDLLHRWRCQLYRRHVYVKKELTQEIK